jgi:multidrug resistance efflux pump
MRGNWTLLAVAAVILGVGVTALSLHFRRNAPLPLSSPAAVVISEPEITLHGAIRPQHVVGVSTPVSGNIDAFLVEVGDEVYLGQLLARIGSSGADSAKEGAAQALERAQDELSKMEADVSGVRMESSRAEADALRARLQMERAQKTYERQSTLNREGATPRLVYEKARQEYEGSLQEYEIMEKAMRGARENVQAAATKVAEAKRIVAERQLERQDAEGAYASGELRSPVDGTVVGRTGEPGKPAGQVGEQIFQIATDLYALEVPLEARPDVLKRLRPGQSATVLVLDLQGGGFPATVKEVKESEAIVEFTSTLPAVRPGMRADVRLKLE